MEVSTSGFGRVRVLYLTTVCFLVILENILLSVSGGAWFLLRCNLHAMQAIHCAFWKMHHNEDIIQLHQSPNFTCVPLSLSSLLTLTPWHTKPVTDLFSVPIVLLFLECPIIRHYVIFWLRFLLLSIMHLRLINVYQKCISWNSWVVLHWWIHHGLLIHSSA